MLGTIREVATKGAFRTLAATRLAKAAFGDTIAANMIMLGFSFQQGALPIPSSAIERAIELNGQAVEMNKKAFRLGRAALNNSETIHTLLDGQHPIREQQGTESSDDKIARLIELLRESHGEKAASTLSGWVGMVRKECDGGQQSNLAAVVAKSGFQVLYSKDEYEVARLYTRPGFRQSLEREFTGDFSLKVHLAPPILSRIDSATGRPVKRAFGPWIFIVFRILNRLRWIRDSWLDPFRYTKERQLAREIRKEYEKTLERLCAGFDRDRPQIAEHIAQWPIQVRGFGPVREEAFKKAMVDLEPLWCDFLDNHKSTSKAA